MIKLLVAMDFTDVSRLACRFAAQYAHGLAAGEIYFLHVLADDAKGDGESELQVIEAAVAQMRTLAEKELITADGTRLTGTIDVRYRAVRGRPDAEILRVAREQSVDGIVVGTSGRTGVGRLLLGSVAEKVVRGASCTVMVVKNKASS